MNKAEKFALSTLVAEWEFTGVKASSVSEAMGKALCARDIIDFLAERNALHDLPFCRVWEALKALGLDPKEEDLLVDVLADLAEEHYNVFLDLIDAAPRDNPLAAREYLSRAYDATD